MNFIARIALSFSLIALIAQPIQAASYADHAKKVGRISAYTLATFAGLYGCIFPITGHISMIGSDSFPYTGGWPNYKLIIPNEKLREKTLGGIFLFGASALLYIGIKGLKKEFTPNSEPITN